LNTVELGVRGTAWPASMCMIDRMIRLALACACMLVLISACSTHSAPRPTHLPPLPPLSLHRPPPSRSINVADPWACVRCLANFVIRATSPCRASFCSMNVHVLVRSFILVEHHTTHKQGIDNTAYHISYEKCPTRVRRLMRSVRREDKMRAAAGTGRLRTKVNI
jgi:hypothetical protein